MRTEKLSDESLTFGRYEALFRIASGGMAEVYAARIRGEAGFQKLVAVKRMLPHLADEEHFVEMFLDEARVAANISSPHVVQTLDLGRADDGALYIVMELIVGVTLSALIRSEAKVQRVLPAGLALELMAQAAQGLDDAHEASTPTGYHLHIVHRDVSPQNILIGIDGRARVTDFGIVRAMLRRTETGSGQLKGKFPYFSPEQADGRTLDRRSDVFALGIVAWETLTGRGLFHNESPLVSLERVRSMAIPPPHEFRPELAPVVSAVVLKALERSVDARYQTAGDFAAALRRVAREISEVPRPREIGKFVIEAGGEALRTIQERIDHGLAGTDAATLPDVNSPPISPEPATVAPIVPGSSSGVRERTPGGGFAIMPGRIGEVVTGPARPLAIRTREERSKKRTMGVGLFATIGVLLVTGFVGFRIFGDGNGSDEHEDGTPMESAAPAPNLEAPAIDPPADFRTPAMPAQDSAPAASAVAPEPNAPVDEPAATSLTPETVTPSPAEPRIVRVGAAPRPPNRRRPERTSRNGSPTAPERQPPQPSEPSPTTVPPNTAESATIPAVTEPAPAAITRPPLIESSSNPVRPRRPGIVGVEQFDRDVARQR